MEDMKILALLMALFLLLLAAACSEQASPTAGTVAEVSTLTLIVRSENGSLLYDAEIYVNEEYKGKTLKYGDTAGSKKVVLQGAINNITVKHPAYHLYTNTLSAVPGGEQSLTVSLEKKRSSYIIEVEDEDGAVAQARVSFYADSSLVASIHTDEYGEAFFSNLSDGNYTIRISKDAYTSVTLQEKVAFAGDGDTIKVEAELIKLPSLTVIVRSDEVLLPDAEVALYDREEFHAPDAYPLNVKFTNEDGNVLFKYIEYDKAYLLVAKRNGFVAETREFTLTPELREVEFDLAVLE